MRTEEARMTIRSSVRFPDETPEYRAARNELLDAEADQRRTIERVAALRRALPAGGAVPADYVFEEAGGGPAARRGDVRLSELFADGQSTLIVYSFMYGPAMTRPCVSCTAVLDGLNGQSPHVNQRVGLVVVARSPADRIRAFAEERGWGHLRLLSSAENTYNRDYHGETPDGGQMPMLNVFVRRDGTVRHFYGTELLYAKGDPGQDMRHVDLIWPLWNLFDLTPDGRGASWYPKLEY